MVPVARFDTPPPGSAIRCVGRAGATGNRSMPSSVRPRCPLAARGTPHARASPIARSPLLGASRHCPVKYQPYPISLSIGDVPLACCTPACSCVTQASPGQAGMAPPAGQSRSRMRLSCGLLKKPCHTIAQKLIHSLAVRRSLCPRVFQASEPERGRQIVVLAHRCAVGILPVITHFYLVDTQLLDGRLHLSRVRAIDTLALQQRLHATHQERFGEHALCAVVEHATGDCDWPENDVAGGLPPPYLTPPIGADGAGHAPPTTENKPGPMRKK